MHKLEKVLLLSGLAICLASILFIPRKRAWEAVLIAFVTQLFSWVLGLAVVEFKLIEYPVRELAKANASSFFFEYLLMPVLAVHFILRYPTAKALWIRILYWAGAMSAFTVTESIVEEFTQIVKYHGWTWYWTFVSMTLVFYFTMVIYKWFFRIRGVFSL